MYFIVYKNSAIYKKAHPPKKKVDKLPKLDGWGNLKPPSKNLKIHPLPKPKE